MKIISNLLLILGALLSTVGILPFIVSYPYNSGPNSGPTNVWELVLMISYEGWEWYLVFGIVFLILSIFAISKSRKLKF